QRYVADLNHLYQNEPALWETDYDGDGFQWVDCSDHENSVLSFLRRDRSGKRWVLVVLNLTPVTRSAYRIGVSQGGHWSEVLNSDAGVYAGSNTGNMGGVPADDYRVHNQPYSLSLTLPPMSVVALRSVQV
ncbi:MAG TPA: alpha amylase C-terminal domain-containing protein, partial [Roseimicrobium sp.]|nr:alpha amylase C-terminal domain-containing protein [Roseimicrobium sp.]